MDRKQVVWRNKWWPTNCLWYHQGVQDSTKW